jgi:hypothetical protein
LLIFVFVAIGVSVAIIAWLIESGRRKALAELARRLGFDFAPGGAAWSGDEFEGYTPFGLGRDRRAFNVLSGSRGGARWELFEYQYTTGSGKDRSTHRYGVALARVGLAFPRLTMRPEGWLDKVASMAGFDDINFESEAFSRRYHVKCDDRRRCYDLIDPRMIEYLLTLPAVHWQLGPGVVLIVRKGRYDPPELERTMVAITGLLERVPEHVRKDLAG